MMVADHLICASHLYSPQLRVPPPVTAEGKPVEPPREKSFLEKYWMYIAIALVAMGKPAVCIRPKALLTLAAPRTHQSSHRRRLKRRQRAPVARDLVVPGSSRPAPSGRACCAACAVSVR